MEEIVKRWEEIQAASKKTEQELKDLVWEKGLKAIAEKMDEYGVKSLALRTMEFDDHITQSDLLFELDGVEYGARLLNLNKDGELVLEYNKISENDFDGLDYDEDEDFEKVIDRDLSDEVITNLFPVLIKNGKDFYEEYEADNWDDDED